MNQPKSESLMISFPPINLNGKMRMNHGLHGEHGYSMLQQYVMQISIQLWGEGFRFHKALVIRVYPCNPWFDSVFRIKAYR